MVLYRVMSTAEYNDLMKDGVWKYGNGSMEGKWFAESYKDAVTWGIKWGMVVIHLKSFKLICRMI
ncbi:hypothetical protein DWV07_06410 [Dickeya zeae]|nr:hypothetical protein DWV07_06410 [Dickeya zeae]